MARLAIVGSRSYPLPGLVRSFVARLRSSTVVVSGGASGVDSWAAEAAAARGLAVDIMSADWARFGRSAGPRRNAELVASVTGLVAFWDGSSRGTAHAISLARQAGIWLRVYGPDGSIIESVSP